MLSRLLASRQPLKLLHAATNAPHPLACQRCLPQASSLVLKRWSGHNAMMIEPSNYQWKKHKDMMHFHFLLCSIPILVITTIINVRANPELIEVPEGYEPLQWEYHRHPIARFLARYCFHPPEFEHEIKLGMLEMRSETHLMTALEDKVDHVMKFYNDHRGKFFMTTFGDLIRIDREDNAYQAMHLNSFNNEPLDDAYNPDITPLPVVGYKPGESP